MYVTCISVFISDKNYGFYGYWTKVKTVRKISNWYVDREPNGNMHFVSVFFCTTQTVVAMVTEISKK